MDPARHLEELAAAIRQRKVATAGQEDLVAEISGILFDADPIGISFESNADEYDSEAEMIVIALARANGPDDVRRLTHRCFAERFNVEIAGQEARYESIAQSIWIATQRSRSSGSSATTCTAGT
jgi:hypothetical protein